MHQSNYPLSWSTSRVMYCIRETPDSRFQIPNTKFQIPRPRGPRIPGNFSQKNHCNISEAIKSIQSCLLLLYLIPLSVHDSSYSAISSSRPKSLSSFVNFSLHNSPSFIKAKNRHYDYNLKQVLIVEKLLNLDSSGSAESQIEEISFNSNEREKESKTESQSTDGSKYEL